MNNIDIYGPPLRTENKSVRQGESVTMETQEEQDRWLLENRELINAKIRRGIAQLDRGEGIPDHQLDAVMAKLKTESE
jgi:hypothetical protein